jgi:2-C-methyl-D-erythritol 2,4-cyclodiphosphate synthase
MPIKWFGGDLAEKPLFLVGCGSDDHRIIKNQENKSGETKPLLLAGNIISKEHSPVAHSDGDAAYHAIINALLLAIGERDIGYYFPDTDPKYSGISSEKMLKQVMGFVEKKGYAVNNVTVMITAKEPKIGPHVEKMKQSISKALGIGEAYVGVGATRGEGSGNDDAAGIHVVAMVSLKSFD